MTPEPLMAQTLYDRMALCPLPAPSLSRATTGFWNDLHVVHDQLLTLVARRRHPSHRNPHYAPDGVKLEVVHFIHLHHTLRSLQLLLLKLQHPRPSIGLSRHPLMHTRYAVRSELTQNTDHGRIPL